MGLDIYTLRSPVFVKPREQATDDDSDALTYIYGDDFPDRLDGLRPGMYRGDQERHGGWSYGGYNRLRELLSEAAYGVEAREVWARPERFASHALSGLVALIHFSDCEGAIGPLTSARIAEALVALTVSDDYAAEGHARLLACFRDAAENDGFAVWS